MVPCLLDLLVATETGTFFQPRSKFLSWRLFFFFLLFCELVYFTINPFPRNLSGFPHESCWKTFMPYSENSPSVFDWLTVTSPTPITSYYVPSKGTFPLLYALMPLLFWGLRPALVSLQCIVPQFSLNYRRLAQ